MPCAARASWPTDGTDSVTLSRYDKPLLLPPVWQEEKGFWRWGCALAAGQWAEEQRQHGGRAAALWDLAARHFFWGVQV